MVDGIFTGQTFNAIILRYFILIIVCIIFIIMMFLLELFYLNHFMYYIDFLRLLYSISSYVSPLVEVEQNK